MRRFGQIVVALFLSLISLLNLVFSCSALFIPSAIRRGGGRSGKAARRSGGNSRNNSVSCFPASAIVSTKNGDISMSNLKVGDVVLTKQGWSQVFMFSHADANAKHTNFVRIHAPPRQLTLTSNHYVFTNFGEVPAAEICNDHYVYDRNGDRLQVTAVQKDIHAKGLYNPHTVSGTIVVDGVISSTFTDNIPTVTGNALLSPMRAVFSAIREDFSFGIFEQDGRIRSFFFEIALKLRLIK